MDESAEPEVVPSEEPPVVDPETGTTEPVLPTEPASPEEEEDKPAEEEEES